MPLVKKGKVPFFFFFFYFNLQLSIEHPSLIDLFFLLQNSSKSNKKKSNSWFNWFEFHEFQTLFMNCSSDTQSPKKVLLTESKPTETEYESSFTIINSLCCVWYFVVIWYVMKWNEMIWCCFTISPSAVLLSVIHGRRSVRCFTAEPVDDRTIATLIDVACCAPSSPNSNQVLVLFFLKNICWLSCFD